ncbi:flavin-containing monooxygenase 5-like isoform X1 [Anguilla anguilla]|uniref:flavin-containing monooxygenase 5-like isoform X1 n=2 Tax=Anguilla anguilla TaxID=7936 RepID=UPI0015A9BF9F|nr:flavin-containing monooxygenase 5-like isoform X1 [Anguilla anguilla]XP_035270366.1 flavin-containing monooxygenase 5-like isoform X1 [Anguilla anguilla]XP_035270367.1 flavin-containing monooxygenase 5-like isoform X1 [Anguilla anguilla]
MTRRVAVIGAGCSGLACIKCCLDEGLVPVCFESSADIGGLWRYKEKPEPGRTNIYRSLICNSSKEMLSYSDFPPPAEFPNNMHHSQLLQYLQLYVEHFNLLQHIQFQTTVSCVKQGPDFSRSGQWVVETEKKGSGKESHIFDAVMVCTGHYTQPHLPLKDFPGISTFAGKYFHSWEYEFAEDLQGKRIVVVGIGNSGGDIAADSSRVAEQVYLSTRRGAWVVSRIGDDGLPADFMQGARLSMLVQRYLPSWADKCTAQTVNQHLNHRLYGLLPSHGFSKQIPVVNDDLPGRIISGRVVVKPNVKQFRGSSVVFEDGTVVDKVDVVVFATGYNYDFPFLPSSLKAKAGYRMSLYKHVFPPSLECPTLAVIGFIHGLGAIIPLAEMQARWATRVFQGLQKLPPQKRMLLDIEKETREMHQRFACSKRNPLQVEYIPYMDDLARQVGVLPNFLGLLLRDPRLGLSVLLGPYTPYQYRLRGPGRWEGARQAILTQWERVTRPFKTRPVPEARASAAPLLLTVSGAALLLAAVYSQRKTPAILPDPAAVLNRLCSLPGIVWRMRPCLKLQ